MSDQAVVDEAIKPLGYRILTVANFSGGEGAGSLARTARVDKSNFADLFEVMRPRLRLRVANALAPGAGDFDIDLTFGGIRDFDRVSLADRIPEVARFKQLSEEACGRARRAASLDAAISALGPLLEEFPSLGGLLRNLRMGESAATAPALAPISAPPPPLPPDSGADDEEGALDRIMGLSRESSEPAEATPTDLLGALIHSAIPRAAGSPSTRGLEARLRLWFDERIAAQADLVLNAPDFARLEASWRGLRLLVEKVDFRSGIVLEAVSCSKSELGERLVAGLLENECDDPGDPPLGLILCDEWFGTAPAELELLGEVAAKCEAVQVVFAAGAGAEFFGSALEETLRAGRSPREALAGAAFAKWRSFRDREESRWLALCANRILLRSGWGGADKPDGMPEERAGGRPARGLWGSPIWALGVGAAASVAADGWPQNIAGSRRSGTLENLPLPSGSGSAGEAGIPLEFGLSENQAQDLAAAGLMPAVVAGRDGAYFPYLSSVAAPKRFPDVKATRAAAVQALASHQLYAGRVARWLSVFLGERPGGLDHKGIQEYFERRLSAILRLPGGAGPELRIEASDHEDNADYFLVCISLSPGFVIAGERPKMLLSVPVAKR